MKLILKFNVMRKIFGGNKKGHLHFRKGILDRGIWEACERPMLYIAHLLNWRPSPYLINCGLK